MIYLKKTYSFSTALNVLVCLLLICIMGSCSEDIGLSGGSNSAFKEWNNLGSDPKNTWMTSINVQLDITVEKPCNITAQTILKDKTTILGQKYFIGSGVMFVDVPQSDIASFGLVYDDGIGPKQYRRIDLTGEKDQVVRISFTSEAPLVSAPLMMAPGVKSQPTSSLCGNSILPDCGYLNFGPWAWEDIAAALTEGVNPKNKHVSLIDYEIMARGQISPLGEFESQETVYISMLYGYTGTTNNRVLGYYVHSPNNMGDIEFYDITETLTYDYINGKGKVQYQIYNNTSTWYDASFYYMDGNGLPAKYGLTPVSSGGERDKDDIYNTYLVSESYGNRVTAVRGLTFKLDIPKGKVFGFYLRTSDIISATQKNTLKSIGVPDIKLPKYAACYTNAIMNPGTNNFRSALAIYDNFTFMGLDDNVNGGDYDCNDVTFALSNVHGEKLRPQFTEETLKSTWNQGTIQKDPIYSNPPTDPTEPSTGTDESGSSTETDMEYLQTWTIAYENGGTALDFDFNDVVLQVTPNNKTHTATVYLMAAGAKRKTEIYYCEQLLGEIHDLFGVEENEMVNTLNANPDHDPVLLSANISWPEGTKMSDGRHGFWIRVYNEDGIFIDIHSNEYLGPNKDIPQAFCVAGEWNWPLETERVFNAYPVLTEWARNINDKEVWNWYAQPDNKKIVKQKKHVNK